MPDKLSYGSRLLIIFLGIFLLTQSGCGTASEEPVRIQEEGEDSLQIGLCFDSFVIERWTRDRDVFVSTAKELGAEVNIQNANGDVDRQASQIEYLIRKGMDVIVIIAIDESALQDVVKKARAEGIRVVCYDRLLTDCVSDLYISFDNVEVGRLMGEALLKELPGGGDIFCIYGSRSDHNVELVREGLTEVLEGSGVEEVYSAYCDNWLAELAFDAVSEGLQKTEPDGIMCGNDDLASQAIRALAEHRLAGKVAVVAQDAELAACQRIVEGTQAMTVFKPVDELARTAARLAVALGEGVDITGPDSPVPVTDTIPAAGTLIPCYNIPPVAVTAANMDKVIVDSGFHMRDEVYLNVTAP